MNPTGESTRASAGSLLHGAPTEPVYRRVSAYLRQEITSGALSGGMRLPAERTLAEALQVSRISVRQALRELAEAGLIASSTSRGWFVSELGLFERANALMSFSELGRSRGLEPSSRVLSHKVRPADLNEADELEIVPGSPLLDLERLRFLDGLEIALHQVRVPVDRAPGIEQTDFSSTSVFEALEEYHAIIPTRARWVIEGRPADERSARLLGLQPAAPLLVVSSTTTDQHDRPFELSRIDYRADRYRFQATIVRFNTTLVASS
ncbi:MAG: GntR family transcriptional regulator [Acidimicrobiales bacterium]